MWVATVHAVVGSLGSWGSGRGRRVGIEADEATKWRGRSLLGWSIVCLRKLRIEMLGGSCLEPISTIGHQTVQPMGSEAGVGRRRLSALTVEQVIRKVFEERALSFATWKSVSVMKAAAR